MSSNVMPPGAGGVPPSDDSYQGIPVDTIWDQQCIYCPWCRKTHTSGFKIVGLQLCQYCVRYFRVAFKATVYIVTSRYNKPETDPATPSSK